MRKIFWFSIISGATLFLFIVVSVILAAVILSARTESSALDTASATDPTHQRENSQEVLLIFDGEDCFMSQLNITPDGELQFSTPFFNGKIGERTLKEYLTENTPDEIVETVCGKSARFVKISPKNFTEITDRYGGLVYNESNGREVMLTGAQALTVLNNATFTDFVVQIVSKARSRNFYDFFLYVSNNTENNLSYIALYDIFKKENAH